MNIWIGFPGRRCGHTVKRFLIICLLLASGVAVVRGQSALDGFDPNANNALIGIDVQPDGKVLIGGTFTTLAPNGGAPVARNRIARLNPNGTLDIGFDPNANGEVRVVVVQPDGKILIGGAFTTVSPNGGAAVARNRIARLNSDGTLDNTFDPNANAAVTAIVVQPDGKILAGGEFTTLSPNGGGPIMRSRIARLNSNGTVDPGFDPNANNHILSIVVQSDGKILVGGLFNGANSIGGQARDHGKLTR